MWTIHRARLVGAAVTLVAAVAGSNISAGQDSVVRSVAVKPETVKAGATVSATAGGSGLCGAVHIDWGDGTAITYPTSTLPVVQSHAYQYGGDYTVRAQGMGNCSGEARTRIRVVGPPPPPPPPPPAPTAPPAPRPDDRPAPSAPRLNDIEIARPEGASSSVRSIRVNGSGRCAYTLGYGDGNSEGRNADLPDSVRHNYPAQGRYTVTATAAAPCTGKAQATLTIGEDAVPRPVPGTDASELTGLLLSRRSVAVGDALGITLQGSGRCRVTVDFGDGRQRELNEQLPYRLTHRYDGAGEYAIIAWTDPPCRGDADIDVFVRRR